MENTEDFAKKIAHLVRDGKGADTVLIDVSELNSWTDYFVIATVNSSTHWQGIFRQVNEFAKQNGVETRQSNKKMPSGDDWNLIDLGTVVVHLMSKEAREFYDLEKLWKAGKILEIDSSGE